jgi:GNAT superfamily N-acetyltransferase
VTRVAVRPATAADAELIVELIRALAEYEREPDAVRATPDAIRRWLFGERPYAECVIAELEGEAVGFAVFFHNFSTWQGRPGIWLEDLFVRPERRGSGAGKALFDHVGRLAVERGCGRYEWAVLDWNEPAIGFYVRQGAKAMDEWTIFRLEGEALERFAAR